MKEKLNSFFAVMYEMCKSEKNGETVYFRRGLFIPESFQIQLHLRHKLWQRQLEDSVIFLLSIPLWSQESPL